LRWVLQVHAAIENTKVVCIVTMTVVGEIAAQCKHENGRVRNANTALCHLNPDGMQCVCGFRSDGRPEAHSIIEHARNHLVLPVHHRGFSTRATRLEQTRRVRFHCDRSNTDTSQNMKHVFVSVLSP
jgi:hypothetical protein